MKKIMKLMSMVLATSALLLGCVKPVEEDPIKLPTIAIESVQEGLTQTVITLTVANADLVKYTYYVKDNAPATPEYASKAVDKDGKVTITLEVVPGENDKAGQTTYTFAALATSTIGDKEYESAVVTKDFKLVPNPILTISSVKGGVGNVVAVVNTVDADKLYYTIYETGKRAEAPTYESKAVTADGEQTIEAEVEEIVGVSGYTIEFYAERTDSETEVYKSIPVTKDFKLITLPALTIGEIKTSVVSATVTLNVSGDNIHYAYYAKDARPETVEYTTKAVEADGEVVVTIDFEANLEAAANYTFEAFADKTIDNELLKTDLVTKDFEIGKAENVNISNLVVASRAVTFNVAMVDCVGYIFDYYKIGDKDMTLEQKKTSLMVPYSQVYDKPRYQETGLKPNTEYVLLYLGVAAIEKNDWGGSAISEFCGTEPLEIKITTPSFEVGQCDMTINPTAITPAPYSISYDAVRPEGAEEFYNGIIRKSDLGSKSVEEYLKEWFATNKWGAPICHQLSTASFMQPDADWNYTLQDRITVVKANIDAEEDDQPLSVSPETDYVIWTLALDANRLNGKIAYAETRTPALTFDGAANITLEYKIATNGQSATFTPTLRDGCVKFSYFNDMAEFPTPLDEIKKNLLGCFANNDKVYPDPYNPETTTFDVQWLTANTDYILYVLPVDAEGKYGVVQMIEYRTEVKPIEFTGTATLTLEVANVSYGKNQTVYSINLTKGDNCDGYVYAANAPAQFGDGDTNEDLANNIMVGDYSYLAIEDTLNLENREVICYGEDYIFLAIPYQIVDNEKVYGTPVLLDLPFAEPAK